MNGRMYRVCTRGEFEEFLSEIEKLPSQKLKRIEYERFSRATGEEQIQEGLLRQFFFFLFGLTEQLDFLKFGIAGGNLGTLTY